MRSGALPVMALGAFGVACGLIDLSSLHGITFQLPQRSYSISADDPRWKNLPSDYPPITCGPPAGLVADCCQPPAEPPGGCSVSPLVCEGGECALKFTYDEAKTIDLAKEVPELQQVSERIISEVYLKSIHIGVSNGLNLALPDVGLYVAPASVTSAVSPSARKVATIPASEFAPGTGGSRTIELSPAAQQAFSDLARDFHTPFNVLVSTTVVLKSGSPRPQGKLDVTVSGTAEATL